MATNHFNITGEVTQELLAAGDNYNISSISLTNVNFGGTTLVDIYIEKELTGKFYLLKKVKLPIGVTLFHNIVSFDNRHFGLYISYGQCVCFSDMKDKQTLTAELTQSRPRRLPTVQGPMRLFLMLFYA